MHRFFKKLSLFLNYYFLELLMNLIKKGSVSQLSRKSPDYLDRLYYKDLSLTGWLGRMKKRKEEKGKQFSRCIRTVNCVFLSQAIAQASPRDPEKPWLRKFRAKCSSPLASCSLDILAYLKNEVFFNFFFILSYSYSFVVINFFQIK